MFFPFLFVNLTTNDNGIWSIIDMKNQKQTLLNAIDNMNSWKTAENKKTKHEAWNLVKPQRVNGLNMCLLHHLYIGTFHVFQKLNIESEFLR